MLEKYEYILFDWDGTLATSLDRWLAALKHSLQAHGYDGLADEDIGANYELFAAKAVSLGVTNPDEVIEGAYTYLRTQPAEVILCEGVKELLIKLLASGKHMAIVTTSRHAQIDKALQRLEIAHFFGAVVCADDVSRLKPDPEPVERAMELLGAEPAKTVMIGDSSPDILAAKDAGIDSMLYFPDRHATFYDKKELTELQPTYIVKSFTELL